MKTATRRKGKLENFEEEYRSALRAYASGEGELALGRAYELGRRALEEQLSVVELASLHHHAIIDLVRTMEDEQQKEELLRFSAEFLAECVSPYEMAHRVCRARRSGATAGRRSPCIGGSCHGNAGGATSSVHSNQGFVKRGRKTSAPVLP